MKPWAIRNLGKHFFHFHSAYAVVSQQSIRIINTVTKQPKEANTTHPADITRTSNKHMQQPSDDGAFTRP